jgi:hypothetical protein
MQELVSRLKRTDTKPSRKQDPNIGALRRRSEKLKLGGGLELGGSKPPALR